MFRNLTRKKQQLSDGECVAVLKEEKRGVVTVMFDDRTRLVIRKKDFEKYPLEKEEEIDFEEYMNAIAGFQAPEAYEAALSLLDYSARTENEMKKWGYGKRAV